ncbi:MAG: tyrosine-type recombinase/integrase [Prochloraceae cyanobacterium]|nr:tyrosine-type recombinase/integrase [Prochloraceae cyanobacterium]
MKVQRIKLHSTHELTWILIGDDFASIDPVNDYLCYLRALERSPNTVENYARHLKLFWEFINQKYYNWKEVGEPELAEFILWLRSPDPRVVSIEAKVAKRTERTINTILSVVYSFYQFHQRQGSLEDLELYKEVKILNPKYKPLLYEMMKNKKTQVKLLKLKEPKKIPDILTTSEVQELIDNCNNLRNKFLIKLLFDTGIRISEALGLRHEDINSVGGKNEIQIVPRKDNVNNAEYKSKFVRIIQTSGDLMRLYARYIIDEYPDVDSDYVFVNIWKGEVGYPMRYSTVRGLFKSLKKKTRIDAYAHLLRHTHATHLIRAGMNMAYVQKRLGHSSIQTTINTYVHLTNDDMKEAYQKYLEKKGV